jgi:hypothetical protein
MPNLIVIRGITDMARLSAASIRSRLTLVGHQTDFDLFVTRVPPKRSTKASAVVGSEKHQRQTLWSVRVLDRANEAELRENDESLIFRASTRDQSHSPVSLSQQYVDRRARL